MVKTAEYASTCKPPSFVLSEYYGRIEKAALEIAKGKEPVDTAIILWFGFDGLRIEGDCFEWISRKTEETTCANNTFDFLNLYSLCQANINMTDGIQSVQAQIDELQAQNAILISALQCTRTMYPTYHPYQPYFYSGCCQQTYPSYCQSSYNNWMMFNRW